MCKLLPLLLVLGFACGTESGSMDAVDAVADAPGAAADETEPGVDEPGPVADETEPAVDEPEPVADEPEPAAVEPEPATAAPEPPAAPPAETTPKPAGTRTPGALYEQCRDRVEQPEADGECSGDADCVATGCGREVCTTAAHADLTTTCEIRQCFSVLQSCGCVKGRCTWSLKDEVPPMKPLKRLDVQ